MSQAATSKPVLNPILKLVLELGPLALFFLSYRVFEIYRPNDKMNLYWANGVMMVCVLVTLGVSYFKMRRIPIMPLVTAAIVVIFGAIAWFLQNETFIKIKPTVIYLLFSGALFFGIAFKKPMLKIMFDGALHLTDAGWRVLTWRWGCFFLVLAGLNEAVWRSVSTEHWVTFKSFGFLPLTVVFALAQAPLIARHEAKGDDEPGAF